MIENPDSCPVVEPDQGQGKERKLKGLSGWRQTRIVLALPPVIVPVGEVGWRVFSWVQEPWQIV